VEHHSHSSPSQSPTATTCFNISSAGAIYCPAAAPSIRRGATVLRRAPIQIPNGKRRATPWSLPPIDKGRTRTLAPKPVRYTQTTPRVAETHRTGPTRLDELLAPKLCRRAPSTQRQQAASLLPTTPRSSRWNRSSRAGSGAAPIRCSPAATTRASPTASGWRGSRGRASPPRTRRGRGPPPPRRRRTTSSSPPRPSRAWTTRSSRTMRTGRSRYAPPHPAAVRACGSGVPSAAQLFLLLGGCAGAAEQVLGALLRHAQVAVLAADRRR
jgi:hypothetical protein